MPVIGNLEYLITAKNDTKAGINSAERDMHTFGDRISAWTIAKGQVIGDFCKRLISSTTTMFTQTFKGAISAYKQFEQLEGGVKLLYKDASDAVMGFAKNAYKYGIDANRYMQATTSFAASLVKSLNGDEVAAAKAADMAIQDMADNAAAFGTDVAMIEHAYMGFARGNFTMLDNLKLGFGGTRSEMERLLKEAGAKTGKKYNINNLNDIFEAIHVIQDELGIAGHASMEAETTIEGSINKMKASWQNLLIAMGSGKDVKKATKEFAESFKKAVKNLLPVAKEVLSNLFVAIGELMPEIGNFISELFSELKKNLPQPNIFTFLETAFNGLSGIIDLVSNLIENFPETVKKLEQSDSPVLRGLGGTLDFIKQTFDWIEKNKTAVIAALGGIALAFAKIKLSIDAGALATVAKFAGLLLLVLPILMKFTEQGGLDSEADRNKALGLDTPEKVEADKHINQMNLPKRTVRTLLTGDANNPTQRFVDSFKTTGQRRTDKLIEQRSGVANAETGDFVLDEIFRRTATATRSNSINSMQPVDETIKWINDNALIANRVRQLMPGRENDMERVLSGNADSFEAVQWLDDLRDAAYNEITVQISPTVDSKAAQFISEQIGTVPVKINPIFGVGGGLSSGLADFVNLASMHVSHKHAAGAWDIPYDNYPALLHRDEMVLNKSQARRYRDGENVDYGKVGQMIGDAISAAMSKVYIMMSGDKVGDITTKRVKNNLNALNYAKLRAMGG